MRREELEKYLNKNVAVYPDKTKVGSNGSKFFKGELVNLADTSLTISLDGCTYASEICINLDIIAFVGLSK